MAGFLALVFCSGSLSTRAKIDWGDNAHYFPIILKAALPPDSGRILINQVCYYSTSDEPGGEWTSLFNAGNHPALLAGYKIGDAEVIGKHEGMLRFPEGDRIQPGEIVVVANKAEIFKATFNRLPDYEIQDSDPAVEDLIRYTSWASGQMEMANSGDELILLGSQDQIVDSLSWGSSTIAFSPAISRVKPDHSLLRKSAYGDTNQAQDWLERTSPNPWEILLPTPPPLPVRQRQPPRRSPPPPRQ